MTIPAGLIQMSNGTKARVFLDRRYVLGPEGAHVNIAGISGLATKTSYALFLIQSILQTVGAKDIAVILLNVKQNDLLVIDKPRKGMKPEEHAMWEYLRLVGLDTRASTPTPRPVHNGRIQKNIRHQRVLWRQSRRLRKRPRNAGYRRCWKVTSRTCTSASVN